MSGFSTEPAVTRPVVRRRRGLAAMLVALLLLLALPLGLATPAAAQDAGMSDWTLLADGGGPGPRWDHTLVADDTGEQLLVFGGRDGAGVPYSDTWLFDLADGAWRQVMSEGPAARFGQAVAVDQAARVLYLQGGQSDTLFFNDTWAFDFATETWTLLHAGDAPAPANRYGHSAVLDGAGHLIISHGFTFEGRFNDTWSFDVAAATWTDRSPDEGEARPLNRCLHEAVWDAAGGRMLLFGGCASGFGPCPLGDLWAYDPDQRSWTELTPATGPAPRMNPALIVAPDGTRAWLIGGQTESGPAGDLWQLDLTMDGARWEELQVMGGPTPRSSHDATLSDGRVYLFGGRSADGALADLWSITL